jgi:hypothetical protein
MIIIYNPRQLEGRLTPSPLSLSLTHSQFFTRILIRRSLHERLAAIKKRTKIKLMAYFAFRQRCSRGHSLSSLRLEDCGFRFPFPSSPSLSLSFRDALSLFSDAAALMLVHAVQDNYHLTDLYLSQNPSLLSTPLACQEMSALVQDGHVRSVILPSLFLSRFT